jgi:hypothetical protein
MIAYDKNGLDALEIRQKVYNWYKKGLISEETLTKTLSENPIDFYTPNPFVRIGLGIFTWIGIGGAIGIMSLLILSIIKNEHFGIFSLICGVLLFVFLEVFIKDKKHYGSGIDDMLLYAVLMAIGISLKDFLPSNPDGWWICCAMLPFFILASIRYLDQITTIASLLCAGWLLFLLVKPLSVSYPILLPFIGMAFAGILYYFAQKMQTQDKFRFWKNNFLTIETFALIVFYLSGNYYVIQNISKEMLGFESVPYPWFFWIFTFVVPLMYIFGGLKRKDRLLLDLSFIAMVATVVTYRTYYNVMPMAWALVLGGAVLFLIAYFSIRYLKENNKTYTYAADEDASLVKQIQGQVMMQTLTPQITPTPQAGSEFGGGEFGGGGAGGEF